MNSLLHLCKEKVFVDGLILTLDHKKFYIDRNIFSAISPYFRALFANSLCPTKQVQEVFLPDIAGDIMSILVDFVYTGELVGVTQQNIERLIQASDRLQIVGALDYCNQYLIASINDHNCISNGKIILSKFLFVILSFLSIFHVFFLFRNLSIIASVLLASCYRKVKIIHSSQLFYCKTFRFHGNCSYFPILFKSDQREINGFSKFDFR
jgi:hypothetical protein